MNEITAEMIERGRVPERRRNPRQRQTASRVREVREKLTSSGTGHLAQDLALLRAYAHSRVEASPALALLLATIGAMATLFAPTPAVFGWMTLVSLSLAVDHVLARGFLKGGSAALDPRLSGWARTFALAEAVQAAAWTMIVGLADATGDAAARSFVLFALLLVGAMTSMIAATVPGAVYAALVPLTASIVVFTKPWTGLPAVPLALLAVGAQLFFAILARRLYLTTLTTLGFEAEKDALIAELEQSKSNSDEARRRSEEANLAKSRFLATMSHELRTPLNAILGFSEVMKGELFGPHAVPAYRDYSRDIHSSGEHLLMLINEILDLSRIEAGRYDLREESVSLAQVAEDCRHLLAMRADKRGIAITEAAEASLPRLWADERALRQVTLNLLSNAIKFTPQGGAIAIKVGWTAAGGQYLSIKDNGPGIPEAEIPVVLASFGRGSMAQKNADEGTGLGLPIVKGLVELHGGTFVLKSKVREGTEAIVIFPPGRVMSALPQLDPDKPVPAAVKRVTRPAA